MLHTIVCNSLFRFFLLTGAALWCCFGRPTASFYHFVRAFSNCPTRQSFLCRYCWQWLQSLQWQMASNIFPNVRERLITSWFSTHCLFLTVLLCVIGRSNAQSFKEEDDPAVDDPPSSFPSNLVLFIAIIIVLVVNPCITVALQGAAVQVWLQSLPSRVSNGATETFDHVKHLAMAKVEEFTLLVGAFLDGEAARGYGDEDDDNEGEFSLSHEEQVVAAEDAV